MYFFPDHFRVWVCLGTFDFSPAKSGFPLAFICQSSRIHAFSPDSLRFKAEPWSKSQLGKAKIRQKNQREPMRARAGGVAFRGPVSDESGVSPWPTDSMTERQDVTGWQSGGPVFGKR